MSNLKLALLGLILSLSDAEVAKLRSLKHNICLEIVYPGDSDSENEWDIIQITNLGGGTYGINSINHGSILVLPNSAEGICFQNIVSSS